MAKLFLSLTFLLLLHGCLASEQSQNIAPDENLCQFQRINAYDPGVRVEVEAGYTDFYTSYMPEFKCVGVEILRHRIQPKGLLLPLYTADPILFYVEKGNGVLGVMLPGCPETYELSQQQFEGSKGWSSFQDRHQKINHIRQGDILAIPTAVSHWFYNDGQDDLVLVALLDSTNSEDQLDDNHRRFFLAGNSKSWGRPRTRSIEDGSENIFRGFSVEIIAEAFNVDLETAEKLQREYDLRGHIIMLEKGLQVIRPPMNGEAEEQVQNDHENGVEETICSMKLQKSIDDASTADIYDPRVGRTTNLNSHKFPILKHHRLSVERGVLYEGGIMSPHWIMNAHTIIYVTNGYMRVQMVNEQGQEMFNNAIFEGQVLVVPENFAMVKQAGPEGCKWISFMTHDNAMINTLAGKSSAISALPVDVLKYAYMISREEARRLKYSREEFQLLTPRINV